MKKQLILLFLVSFSSVSFAQVHGIIKDNAGQGIPGAHIHWLGTDVGTLSDESGHFIISQPNDANTLIFSSIGFASDTVNVAGKNNIDQVNVILDDHTELAELTVTQRRSGKYVNRLAVQNMETLNTNELRKAACCNLSESFTTNPSVDVSYSDAATGAKQIKLLGLSGSYVQMLTENIPNLRGLSSA